MYLNQKTTFIFIVSLLFTIGLTSCESESFPKPKGYCRIDLPAKKYQHYNSPYPYTFDYPIYSNIIDYKTDSCWINIVFPTLNGKIHISYKNVKHNIAKHLEDTRTLAYKHTIKADAIGETPYYNNEKKVYGILYEIKGNAASSLQFFLTDSTEHFIRGALYFEARPNKDSLAPVIDFLKKDVIHLIETLEWQQPKAK